MITITFYDAAGKTVLLKQIWFFNRVEENGVAKMKNLHLFQVTEPDATGHDARAWTWSVFLNASPTIWSYAEFNKVAGSPPVLCQSITTYYQDDVGWSKRTEYDPADRKLPSWTQAHTAQDNLRPPPVPAAEVVFPQLQDLPIPQEQHEHGMH
jgi:hypothetical protein